MQRLFVGVALDDATRSAIDRSLDGIRREAARVRTLRLLPKESWHFTLQFLGAVEDDVVAAVGAGCLRAATRVEAFELELSGAGAFSSVRTARVLWVGVRDGTEQMRALSDAVHAETAELGFAREEREYSPHLTFGRLKRPANVEALIARLELPASVMPVHEIALFRSHLSQQGSRYEVLGRYPLGHAVQP